MGKRVVHDKPAMTLVKEAKLYQQCVDQGMTHGQIADKYGKDRTHIANTVNLLQLPQYVLDYMDAPPSEAEQRRQGIYELTMAHARSLKGMKDFPVVQKALFERIKFNGVPARFCEGALKALSMGIKLGLSAEIMAQAIRAASGDIHLPLEFLSSELGGYDTVRAAARQMDDIQECLALVAQLEHELQTSVELRQGQLIIDLQNDPILLKRLVTGFVGVHTRA